MPKLAPLPLASALVVACCALLALSAVSCSAPETAEDSAAETAAEDPADDDAADPAAADDSAQARKPLPIVPADVPGLPKSVVIGDVIVSGQPTPEGLVNARDSGASLVVNARMNTEMSFDERSVVQGLGMRYVNLGFTPQTLSDTLVDSFIFEMGRRKPEDGKLLLHCSSGSRVAALWAMYEIKALKVDPQTAVERARQIAPLSTEMVIAIGDYARRVGAL